MKWVLIRAVPIWISLVSITFLSGCSTLGNVVPKEGPTMEKTYDSMNLSSNKNPPDNVSDFTQRNKINLINLNHKSYPILTDNFAGNSFNHEFYKIPNPPLEMYIFPHLVGKDDNIPIPGYTTVFNVYEQNHYEINGIHP